MAKDSGMLVLLAAGAVVGLVLLTSKKAQASAPAAAKLPAAAKKPVVEVDADEGQPSVLPDIPLPPSASLMPREDVVPPPRESPPAVLPELPDLPVMQDVPDMPPAELVLRPTAQPGGRWSVTNEDGSPVTQNPGIARSKAQSMADHLRTKKAKYDRPRLAVWQALAGIPVDGLYGPGTQSALSAMGAKNVPKPVFKGGK